MMPGRAFVTADAVLAVFGKSFVTLIAVFVNTVLALPWFVWIFFVQFDGIVI